MFLGSLTFGMLYPLAPWMFSKIASIDLQVTLKEEFGCLKWPILYSLTKRAPRFLLELANLVDSKQHLVPKSPISTSTVRVRELRSPAGEGLHKSFLFNHFQLCSAYYLRRLISHRTHCSWIGLIVEAEVNSNAVSTVWLFVGWFNGDCPDFFRGHLLRV